MKNKDTFSNGSCWYPSHVLDGMTSKWIKRKEKNKPNLIIIDGVSSSGKTTLGVQCMDALNKACGFPEVDLGSECIQVGTGVNDFIKKLRICAEKGLPCVMFDEAGEYNKRGWNTQLNKVMDSIIDTFRAYKITIFMVLHDFAELPKHVWSTRIVSTLIHLKERKSTYGRAFFYSQERIYWIIKYKKDAVYPEYAYNKEHYNVKVLFRNLIPERAKQLDVLSTQHKKRKLDQSDIKLNGLVNAKLIAEQLGMSKVWVDKKLILVKAKPERVYKLSKYYDKSMVDKLRFLIKR